MPIEHRLLTAVIFLVVYLMTQINTWFEKRIERITYITVIFAIIQLIYVSYLMNYQFVISINILIILAIANLIFKGDRFSLYTNVILALLVALSLYFVDNINQSPISFLIGYIVIAGLTYYISYLNYKIAKELQDSEERYRTIFKTAPVGILLLDKQGTIMEANKALCEITGYSRDELEGYKVTDKLVSPSQVEISKKHIQDILDGNDLEFDTTTITKENNEIYTYLKESSIILPNGEQGILLCN
jgi:PAS domain S-box-containing protein